MSLDHIDPSGVNLFIGGLKLEGFLPDLPSKPDYCYQDTDGLVHMGDYKTGFHCVMGQDYFQNLLNSDIPKSFDDQVKDVLVHFVIDQVEINKRPAKPWYRKERW